MKVICYINITVLIVIAVLIIYFLNQSLPLFFPPCLLACLSSPIQLFNILEHLDIDGNDLRVIRNLYWDQSAAVRIGGELSEYKLINRGVRQGCVMSPDLFNIYTAR